MLWGGNLQSKHQLYEKWGTHWVKMVLRSKGISVVLELNQNEIQWRKTTIVYTAVFSQPVTESKICWSDSCTGAICVSLGCTNGILWERHSRDTHRWYRLEGTLYLVYTIYMYIVSYVHHVHVHCILCTPCPLYLVYTMYMYVVYGVHNVCINCEWCTLYIVYTMYIENCTCTWTIARLIPFQCCFNLWRLLLYPLDK